MPVSSALTSVEELTHVFSQLLDCRWGPLRFSIRCHILSKLKQTFATQCNRCFFKYQHRVLSPVCFFIKFQISEVKAAIHDFADKPGEVELGPILISSN